MSSARDVMTRRERIAFEQEFDRQQREREDRPQYEKYVKELRGNGIEPLSFEEWQQNIPEEFQAAEPSVRGAVASNSSIWSGTVGTLREMVASRKLPDDTLNELGFDLSQRVKSPQLQVSDVEIRATFEKWMPTEPRFDYETHIDGLAGFLTRNELYPTWGNVGRAFNLLVNLCALPPKPEREPEPQRPQVNLQIESDPQIEKQKQWERYTTEIVVTDPETGEGWTQYMLDHKADADTFARLMRIPRITKNPALEPKH